jgi:hypothetical protein
MGEVNVARLITNWEDYQRLYGGFAPATSYVAQSVFQFFNNGGRSCYVLRVAASGAEAAQTTLKGREQNNAVDTIKITARSPGSWGNSLFVSVFKGTLDGANEFGIAVRRRQGADSGDILGQPPLEVHDNLSLNPEDERFLEAVLKRNSRLIDAKVLVLDSVALMPVERVGLPQAHWPTKDGSFRLRVNGATYTVTVSTSPVVPGKSFLDQLTAALDAVPPESRPTVRWEEDTVVFSSVGPSTDVPIPSLEVLPLEGDTGRDSSFVTKIGFWPGDNPSFRSPYRSRLPALTAAGALPARLLGGDGDGDVSVFGANASAKSALDRITDASLLVLPGLSEEYSDAVGYCENRPLRDMFFIGDCKQPTGHETQALSKVKSDAGSLKKNGMGALYFPWILVRDPTGASSGPIAVPPSGFVAGIYARTDRDRGVWKAPAGVEASLTGAVGLTHYVTDEEQGTLNLTGINVLRKFDAGGLVVWGARTLSSDASQRYIPVRRVQSMIQRSVYDGLQSAVFQPNSHLLWAALKSDVGAFLNALFRAGAFQGETARQAYFVRCGLGETMAQSDIDLGMVIVDVGFAPLKPAEFVIVRVQHAVNPS